MVKAFTQPTSTNSKRGLAVAVLCSVGAYAAVGLAVARAAAHKQMHVEPEEIQVAFAPPKAPEPPPPPAPADLPPPDLPPPAEAPPPSVKPATAPKKPQLVPTKVSQKKLAESDSQRTPPPEAAPGPLSDGPVAPPPPPPDPVAPPPPPPPPPPPEPKPEPAVVKKGPIQLPEDADPPVPDDDNPQPEYPEAARAAGQTGEVVLKIVIGESGRVERVQVLRGDPLFADAAVAAVKRWRYTPAKVDGESVSCYRVLRIPFRLKS